MTRESGKPLSDRVAGASRGCGRGLAVTLGEGGWSDRLRDSSLAVQARAEFVDQLTHGVGMDACRSQPHRRHDNDDAKNHRHAPIGTRIATHASAIKAPRPFCWGMSQ